jgi:hypothetical protein
VKALHHPVGISVLADSWNYKSKSSGLWATAAALLHYGLLKDEGSGDKRRFTLTEAGLRIARDPDPESAKRLELIQKAARTPKIFQELWDAYGSAQTLSDMVFKSRLTVDRADHGLAPYSEAAAEEVIKSYRETVAFAKLADSATVPPSSEEKEVGDNLADGELEGANAGELPDPPPPPKPEPKGKVTVMAGERIVFTEESGPQNYLKLVASGDVDETMLEALEDYVKRQKRRLGVAAPQTVAAGGKVPFMITQAQKEALRAKGFEDDQIAHMTPEKVHQLLGILPPPPY